MQKVQGSNPCGSIRKGPPPEAGLFAARTAHALDRPAVADCLLFAPAPAVDWISRGRRLSRRGGGATIAAMNATPDKPDRSLIADHRRQWRDCLYVYPVISRRSGGLSIGVNLNPNRQCTFGCVYCQIDRRTPRNLDFVDLDILRLELASVLLEVKDGSIWQDPRFAAAPDHLRRVNDIAFSGDGEPTCHPEFDKAVRIAAEEKARVGLGQIKIVVITNATQLDRPQMHRALGLLDIANGEIWAKLDAGTEAHFQRVNRPAPGITLQKIVDDIALVARGRGIVIQTLLMKLDGQGPDEAEIDAYIGHLRGFVRRAAKIKLVQIHTVARSPAEDCVGYIPGPELHAIAGRIAKAVPELTIQVYEGCDAPPQAG